VDIKSDTDDLVGKLHGGDDIQHIGRLADLLSFQKVEMVEAATASCISCWVASKGYPNRMCWNPPVALKAPTVRRKSWYSAPPMVCSDCTATWVNPSSCILARATSGESRCLPCLASFLRMM
jgi:hypothetical protein